MPNTKVARRRGFSLVELVVVIVIIGIIAAMAIPRLSRGSSGAGGAALKGDLAMIRSAINMYAAEHMNALPGNGGATLTVHMTQFSDASGDPKTAKDATHIYGPYLQAMPPCPVGNKGTPTAVLVDSANSPPKVAASAEGWVYNPTTGEIIANSSDLDDSGKAYSTY